MREIVKVQRKLTLDIGDGRDVGGQQIVPFSRDRFVATRERVADAEGIGELEAEPTHIVQRVLNVPVERLKAAGSPCAPVALLGAGGESCAERKYFGHDMQKTQARFLDELHDLGEIALRLEDVDFVDHQHDFLPQFRMLSRNTRSLSVKGRSADVTNSTRSARGTKSRVRRSCARLIAFVPGVSTMCRSRSNGVGAVTTCMPEASTSRASTSP